MTREEAIKILDRRTTIPGDGYSFDDINLAINMAIDALRPVSREQVGKAEWIWSTGDVYICSSCGEKTHVDERMEAPLYKFCPFCMYPMTDEAVQMVMERMEALHDTGN